MRKSAGFAIHMGGKLIEEIIYRNKIRVFEDRIHAGKLLAKKLANNNEDFILLAIPSGGVPVGYTISNALGMNFDLMVVRKLQIPWNIEAGFGAISWDGEVVLNEELTLHLGFTEDVIKGVIRDTLKGIKQRIMKLSGNKPFPNIKGKKVVIVDDGLASGYTMLAAIKSVQKRGAKKITVAVPTASASSIKLLLKNVDVICINVREGPYFAVADAYKVWYDLSDEEVIRYLKTI